MASEILNTNSTQRKEEPDVDVKEYDFIYGYVSVIERYPVTIMTLVMLITMGCAAIAVLSYGIPSFDNPKLGIETRNTELSARELSFVKFINADVDTFSPIPRKYLAEHMHSITQSTPEKNMRSKRQLLPSDHGDEHTCPALDGSHMKIVYRPSVAGADLFDAEHLKSICRQEEALVRSHQSFIQGCTKKKETNVKVSCCPSWSLGYAVSLLNNKSSCSEITQQEVKVAKVVLRNCSRFYLAGDLSIGHANNDSIPVSCIRGRIVYNVFHFLTPMAFVKDLNRGTDALEFTLSFSPTVDHKDDAISIYKDNFQNGGSLDDGTTKIVALDFLLKETLFDRLLFSDFRFIALGVLIIAIIIWVYIGSFVIMTGSLLNMLFSTILAYFLYHVVFQVHFFPFINIAAVVLVIGIGADDTFVYIDLWKAAKEKGDGIGGKCKRVSSLKDATKHAALSLFVTTFTTSSALYATTFSNIIAIKGFAVFAGTILIANFIYTIVWMPTVIMLHEKYFETEGDSKSSKGNCYLRGYQLSVGKLCHSVRVSAILRGTFDSVLPWMIYSLRYVWIAFFLLAGISQIIFAFVYPRFKLAEGKEFQTLADSHLFEQFDQLYKSDFWFTKDSAYPISFIWGVLPTRDQNVWDPVDFGHHEHDSTFQFGDELTQNWLFNFCQAIKQQWFYGNKTSFCFIDSFKEWMSRQCLTLEESPCCNQISFPFSKDLFDVCSKRYSIFLCRSYPCVSHTPGIRFDKNDTINALYLYFDSSVTRNLEFKRTDDFWKGLQDWTGDQFEDAPPGLSKGWSYSKTPFQLVFYDLQSGLTSGTWWTICIALATAAVVTLISTANIHITLFAVVTILFTVISTVGTLVWIGWELNLFESITLNLAVGLSVDFSLHFGVAYGVTPFEDRKARTMYVIKTLVPSITAAAVSTFSAGAVMINAVVLSYYQIGVFLMVVMSFSWLYSVFLFLPLCCTFGPNGDIGKLLSLFRGRRKR